MLYQVVSSCFDDHIFIFAVGDGDYAINWDKIAIISHEQNSGEYSNFNSRGTI